MVGLVQCFRTSVIGAPRGQTESFLIKEQNQPEATRQTDIQENADVASSMTFSGGCPVVIAHPQSQSTHAILANSMDFSLYLGSRMEKGGVGMIGRTYTTC